MKRHKHKQLLRFNKRMIAEMLNVDVTDLNSCLSDDAKKEVGWQPGPQSFYDVQVHRIIKDFRRLATDQQITEIIYPLGMF